jgi:hypothetical protein
MHSWILEFEIWDLIPRIGGLWAARNFQSHHIIIHPIRPNRNIFLTNNLESHPFIEITGGIMAIDVQIENVTSKSYYPTDYFVKKHRAVTFGVVFREDIDLVEFINAGIFRSGPEYCKSLVTIFIV